MMMMNNEKYRHRVFDFESFNGDHMKKMEKLILVKCYCFDEVVSERS